MPCQYFSVPRFSVPCRAKIFRAMIFRAVPCHKSPGPPFRAVPGRPCYWVWVKSGPGPGIPVTKCCFGKASRVLLSAA